MRDAQSTFLRGFAQKGMVRVMNVNTKDVFDTKCDRVLEPKWFGRRKNGEYWEGKVSQIIEKPGMDAVEVVRERAKVPDDDNRLDEFCFFVAIQRIPGYPTVNPDGPEKLWEKMYDYYVQIRRSKSYIMCFKNHSLITSDVPVAVDENSDTLMFPIQHNMAVIFRHAKAPQTFPTPQRINWLIFKQAKNFIMFHPESVFGDLNVPRRTL